MPLDGKIVLITGAGSGIGQALARELASHGARLLLVGRRVEALEATRASLPDPRHGMVLAGDITDPHTRAALATKVSTLGRLDILINNAGLVETGPLRADDAFRRRRMVEINLLAPIELTMALLPILRASAPARIVNVGSMFGDIAFPGFAAYSATKFGLRGWSEGLRRELAPSRVAVSYAAPRGTRTPAAEGFAELASALAMPLDPPEKVAQQIVAGIRRGARDIYPNGPERWFVLLQRLMPGLIDRVLIRRTAGVIAALSTEPA
ncbi:MAG: SDR family NAD(P)-dependent oxidoreductase [Azospirillaceae bacterium]|nr:SDR family NAD(P)-dependent oxidoreductase [Azospirillaceae bacterium]